MNKIPGFFEELQKVWDTGSVMQYDLPEGVEMLPYKEDFKARTGSQRVVALRWTHRGVVHEQPMPATPLPDYSGLVMPIGPHPYKKLIVINVDGSSRCEIVVPRIDERSRPEDGYLELPPSQNLLEGITWGVMCYDGYGRYLVEFDWQNGNCLRFAPTPLSWM